jgi:2-polyprenyl-3-methyl-5-hydroxy-6-metoxy-1,4-benzoquinol methylase
MNNMKTIRSQAIEAIAAVPGWGNRMSWNQRINDATASLDALLAQLASAGLRVVPVDATEPMVTNARKHHEGEPYLPASLYRAMIAAAPNPLAKDEPND